jgi:hypothetical protein
MPCIGILGLKISIANFPDDFIDLILKKDTLKLSEKYKYTDLKIYTINYNNIEFDIYIDSYIDYFYDRVYIIYDTINSSKTDYFDNDMPLWPIIAEKFDKFVNTFCEKFDFDNVYDRGFFVIEE